MIKDMLKLKRHWDIITINLIGLSLGILLFYNLDHKTEVITAVLATSIALSLGIRTYNIEDDKIFKDLFQSFNERYDKLNDDLNSESTDIKKKIIIDYLNLCAEE